MRWNASPANVLTATGGWNCVMLSSGEELLFLQRKLRTYFIHIADSGKRISVSDRYKIQPREMWLFEVHIAWRGSSLCFWRCVQIEPPAYQVVCVSVVSGIYLIPRIRLYTWVHGEIVLPPDCLYNRFSYVSPVCRGCDSSGHTPAAKCPAAKCPAAKCPAAKCPRTFCEMRFYLCFELTLHDHGFLCILKHFINE